jgi:hypothetical protein
MAINVASIKKGILEVRHVGKDGISIFKSIPIPVRLARTIHEAGAKRSMRKSERGGEYDTIVVRLTVDNGKAGGASS